MIQFARAKWFKELSREDTSIIGEKAASLAELWNAGFPVPNGFVISSEMFEEFTQSARIDDALAELFSRGDAEGMQRLILSTPLQKEISEEITDNYEALDEIKDVRQAIDLIKSFKNEVSVAVRSSSNQKTQHASFLNVKGNNNIVRAVKGCWASLFTTEAMEFYKRNVTSFDDLSMSVIIQKMINQEKSGFAMPDSRIIMIQGYYGATESILHSTPDNFLVDKQTLQIIDKKVNKQDYAIFYDAKSGATQKSEIVDEYKSRQKISDKQLLEIARLSREIEEKFGSQQLVEWTIAKDAVNILQVRPIEKETIVETPAQPQDESPVQSYHEPTQELAAPLSADEDDDSEPSPYPTQEPPFDLPSVSTNFMNENLLEEYETSREEVQSQKAMVQMEEYETSSSEPDSLEPLWKKTAGLRNDVITALQNPDLADEQVSKLSDTLKLFNRLMKDLGK